MATRHEHRTVGLLVILCLFHVALDVLVANAVFFFGPFSSSPDLESLIVGILLGFPFGQTSLLAVWTAFGKGSFFVRAFVALLVGGGIWALLFRFTFAFGIQEGRHYIPGLAMVVQWFVIQAPLWILRRNFGWRLTTRTVLDDQVEAGSGRLTRELQFGVKHLLGWMTLIAVALSIAKLILMQEELDSADLIGFSLFLILNSLFVWPALIVCLAGFSARTGFLVAFGLTVLITLVEPYIFEALVRGGGGDHALFVWANGVQFVCIVGSILFLRRIGYRIAREH